MIFNSISPKLEDLTSIQCIRSIDKDEISLGVNFLNKVWEIKVCGQDCRRPESILLAWNKLFEKIKEDLNKI